MRQEDGNRPGFSTAAAPDEGRRLYGHFSAALAGHGVPVANGIVGADMKVTLTNDGRVTIGWTVRGSSSPLTGKQSLAGV